MAIESGAAQPVSAVETGEYVWNLPAGFPAPKVPNNNPITVEKVELGRFLFYDTRLSGNGTLACGSCHLQDLAFTDGLAHAVGSTGEVHPRSSMSLTNAGYSSSFTWGNPVIFELEDQALGPMFGEAPVELGLSGREDDLLARIRADRRYQRMFSEAFPADDPLWQDFPEANEPLSRDTLIATITRAIASWERTLISGSSAYDRFTFGLDDDAMSDSALRGAGMFFSERLECFHCHGGFNFSFSVSFVGNEFDEIGFFNTGLYNLDGKGAYPAPNTGIYSVTGEPRDMGRFKAPTLRNIELTAPYMHDGSIATLEEVIDHYAAGGRTIENGPHAGVGSASPLKDGFVVGFSLDPQETEDLLAFLRSLTDREFTTKPTFSDPFSVPACPGDCNLDAAVTVQDLIANVNVALGRSSLARCVAGDSNGDGNVTVGELISAVRAALDGCP